MNGPSAQPAILFDLDGTLTDPFVGITRSIVYALERMGLVAPAAEDLRWCTGPPLRPTFATLLGTTDPGLIDQAIGFYRERYDAIGKFENTIVDGIPEIVARFHEAGYFLSIATSKLQRFAVDIVDHFGLRPYFHVIHGSDADGRNADKAHLLAHILAAENLSASSCVMIGDRSHDMVGASANGVAGIGVLWGYGDREELVGAGAAAIADTPDDLPVQIGRIVSGIRTVSVSQP